MKQKHKYLLVALLAALLTLAVSAGLALAQDDAAPAEGQGIMGPRGGHGPGGLGEPGEMRDLMVGGEVVSVSESAITLKTIRSGEEVTVTINGDTAYRKVDGEATLADVVTGEHVGIKLTEAQAEGVEMVAETVIIGAPHRGDRPHPAMGDVTAVVGNNITISTADGEQQFTIPQVSTGMRLGVATDDDGNVKAVIYDPPERTVDATVDAE